MYILDFKWNLTKKDEDHFILITEKNDQDEVLIMNKCAPNTKLHTFVKDILLNLNHTLKPTH